MILVAGGTGTLGSRVVTTLTAGGRAVRVLTRDAERARHLERTGAEVFVGDLLDTGAVCSAMDGITTVVSAAQGFAGPNAKGGTAVDVRGNANLTQAGLAEGIERFVLVSAAFSTPDSPLELRRAKYQAEQALMHSGLSWAILRPTVYLETWLGLLGEMIAGKGSVTLFGRGDNPINFVSADDVAVAVERLTSSPEQVGAVLEIGGPEDITLNTLAGSVLAAHGSAGSVRHVPLPVMRTMAMLLRRVKPSVAMLAQFGVIMDTTDMTLALDAARAAIPDLPTTTLGDLLAAA